MEILNHIHIFKTNIEKENLPLLKNIFTAICSIIQWNVDTEDCDNVLRVESYELTENDIIRIVSGHGFHCETLN